MSHVCHSGVPTVTSLVDREDEVMDRLRFRRYLPIHDFGPRKSSPTNEVCILLFFVVQGFEMGLDGERHDSRWIIGKILSPRSSIQAVDSHGGTNLLLLEEVLNGFHLHCCEVR